MAEQWSIENPTTLDVGSEDEPIRAVEVRLVSGRISVVATETDDGSARVEANEVRGGPLDVSLASGTLVVSHPKGINDGWLNKLRAPWQDMSAVVSITAPAGARVSLATVSAETLVSGMRAPVAVKTVSGEQAVDSVTADVDSSVVSGAVEVRELRGRLSVKSVSGDVTVHARALPRLDAKTVSGELTVDLADADDAATLRSEQSAKTVSGAVTVRLPAGAGYKVAAKSVSGDIVAGGERIGRSPGQSRGTMRSGSEGVQIDVQTLSGDVTVLHAAEQPVEQ
jgi:Putative adhesin